MQRRRWRRERGHEPNLRTRALGRGRGIKLEGPAAGARLRRCLGSGGARRDGQAHSGSAADADAAAGLCLAVVAPQGPGEVAAAGGSATGGSPGASFLRPTELSLIRKRPLLTPVAWRRTRTKPLRPPSARARHTGGPGPSGRELGGESTVLFGGCVAEQSHCEIENQGASPFLTTRGRRLLAATNIPGEGTRCSFLFVGS